MILALIISALLPALALLLFALPLLALEAQRHASRLHAPRAGELWSQDAATLLFIDTVDASGVHVVAIDRASRAVTTWDDTWSAWAERCRARVVLFTGRTGSLNLWDAMIT